MDELCGWRLAVDEKPPGHAYDGGQEENCGSRDTILPRVSQKLRNKYPNSVVTPAWPGLGVWPMDVFYFWCF